ncbi:hypothetical protein [uncultured Mycolicibacterium sp.]|uniref:hypothetical protein n=1 Tax=uncultured Mycolicibacterium sp. TaxID=2320817 RepID=UPI002610BF34|nr:hypothetical protein [uncultured Mycolicibacterium sp.]
MSRRSEAKAARRRKRRAARETVRIPKWLFDIGARAERFDKVLLERGWTFDEVHSDDGLAAWYFEPSGVADLDDEDAETVTRVWFTYTVDGEPGPEDFPDAVHLILVGSAEDLRFTDVDLLDALDVVEAHRAGDPVPTF